MPGIGPGAQGESMKKDAYRLLKNGDMIQAHDEWRNERSKWVALVSGEFPVGEMYRRSTFRKIRRLIVEGEVVT